MQELDHDGLKKYVCQLERVILEKNSLLDLKYLRNNIDSLEKQVMNEGQTEETVVAKLPTKMVSTTDQSFITFMNGEPSRDDYQHTVGAISPALLRESSNLLPLLDRMTKLVHVFLNVCETNFFYVHPRDCFKQLDKLYLNKASSSYLNNNWQFLVHLLGILSIATSYEYIQDNDEIPPKKDEYFWDDPGYKYFLQMLPFVGYLLHTNNLESVQAFQIMGVYMTTKRVDNISRSVDHGYWYMCMALEVAINNKIHLHESYQELSSTDSEFRKRIWWSCYCLERRLGFNLGKPELLKSEAITIPLPNSEPSLTHLDGTSNWENQRFCIEIIKLFGKIANMVYNATNESSITILSKTVRTISLELDLWKLRVLDARKRQSTAEVQALKYRANRHLDLFFFLGKIYLGKPFLLYHVENHRDLDKSPSNPQHVFMHYMTSVCVDAAFNIFNILTEMKKENKLGIYSSTDLNFCNIGLFVTVVFLKIDSSDSTLSFLRKGLEILKELSKGSSSAKVNRSMFSKFDKLTANQEPQLHALSPGLFPDWDIDIYANNFPQYNNMGTLSLPVMNNNNEMSGYHLYDDLLSDYFWENLT